MAEWGHVAKWGMGVWQNGELVYGRVGNGCMAEWGMGVWQNWSLTVTAMIPGVLWRSHVDCGQHPSSRKIRPPQEGELHHTDVIN